MRRSPVKWIRADNRAMPPGSTDRGGRLTMPNIQPEHSGVYICTSTTASPSTSSAQKAAFLTVQPCKYADYCDLAKIWGLRRRYKRNILNSFFTFF